MEKAMATHSSILAWRIPWTEEPGRLQFIGSHRVRHDWNDLARMQAAIKRNKPGSFVETWMNPDSVIQSEVRKRKNKYHILTHPCGNLEILYRSVVPNLFGTRGRFRGRQFFHGLEVGVVFRWFKHFTVSEHFITSASPQIVRHQILEVKDPYWY